MACGDGKCCSRFPGRASSCASSSCPPVDPGQIEQVVTFEAQQNVPFPINEVTWDYQMMPNRSTGSEAEAVIVAIKKDILEAEVAAVEEAGVKIKRVDVAPFALLNAFRYSEAQTEETALIIDMGARSTNLVFVEKSSFWIRNVPIAGNQISQSICNEMQEPFAAAETLKKGKGFRLAGRRLRRSAGRRCRAHFQADPLDDDASARRYQPLHRLLPDDAERLVPQAGLSHRRQLAAALPRPVHRGQAEPAGFLFQSAAQRHHRPGHRHRPAAAAQLLCRGTGWAGPAGHRGGLPGGDHPGGAVAGRAGPTRSASSPTSSPPWRPGS